MNVEAKALGNVQDLDRLVRLARVYVKAKGRLTEEVAAVVQSRRQPASNPTLTSG